MEETATKPTIAELLSKVMAEVGAIAKTDKNQAQNFNFRGIDSVVNAVSPALQRNGVVVVPHVEDYQYSTVEIGRNRTPMGHVRVKVTYTFIGQAGDAIGATVVGEAMDSGDKATAKAMSVAFRTALLQALCLPTDEVDPDASSYERSSHVDVMPVGTVLAKVTASTTVDELAEVGKYITTNKDGYSVAEIDALRKKFQEQQTKLTTPVVTEIQEEVSEDESGRLGEGV